MVQEILDGTGKKNKKKSYVNFYFDKILFKLEMSELRKTWIGCFYVLIYLTIVLSSTDLASLWNVMIILVVGKFDG